MRGVDLPLDGLVVVSLEQAIAAPLATRHLADLGARVIKIERPGVGDFARAYDHRVDGLASHFVWADRSKESLTLNPKDEAGLSIMRALLERADVFIQNLAPGATARLGLNFEALAPSHPRLIVCDISGYGEGGPYSRKKAYDLLVQSDAGFLSVTGSPSEEARAGISIADISAGMYAYSNILAALIQRSQTGMGRRIEISMLESMVEWMGFPLYYAYKGQGAPPRSGSSHATIYPYGSFQTSDGQRVMLGVENEREWSSFCTVVMRRPELEADPRFSSNAARSENRFVLKELIDSVFSGCSAEEILSRLEDAGIANARVNTMADVWAHAQLKARQRWVTVGSPVGELPALLPPGFDKDGSVRMGAVPDLGEHSEAILTELGFSDRIAELRQRGVV